MRSCDHAPLARALECFVLKHHGERENQGPELPVRTLMGPEELGDDLTNLPVSFSLVRRHAIAEHDGVRRLVLTRTRHSPVTSWAGMSRLNRPTQLSWIRWVGHHSTSPPQRGQRATRSCLSVRP